MRSPLFAALLCAAACLIPSTSSAAGPPQLSSQQRTQAKRLFDQGTLAYRRGDYEESILRWQESYQISHHPLTFEAIANAYEKLGDYEAALDYLKRWRAKAPRREHEVLDARIDNYQRQLTKQRQAQAQRDAERLRIEQAAQQKFRRQQRAEAERGAAPLGIVGWTLVGVGGASIITGVALDAVAAADRPNTSDVCRDSQQRLLCLDSQRDNIHRSNTLAIAGDGLWIGGIVLSGTGAALLLLDALSDGPEERDTPATAQVRIAPIISRTTQGVGFVGMF